MTALEAVQLLLYLVVIVVATPLLGGYMAKVFEGHRVWPTPALRPVENVIYRLTRVDAKTEMNWRVYVVTLIAFKVISAVVVFLILIWQNYLPLNPAGQPGMPLALAFNTAISFMTNTNWQNYAGETTLSYFSQMVALAVQNFTSAAVGIAAVIALTRGLVRRTSTTVGNFWVDLVRGTLYVLLPIAVIFAVILVWQGVPQNFSPYVQATTLNSGSQILPMGPVASQEAIKMIGTNGGGFFNANSAHPFENPTPFTNFLEVFSILWIPAALTYTYGVMVGSRRQGWTLFAAMYAVFIIGLALSLASEYSPNPSLGMPGGSLLEGKELRFGIANSVLWSTATTDASNGSVNAMHDSLTPLAGMVATINMQVGEVIFGGVGSGLYGLLVFTILTVFIAGLMVGRTPEYLGKKIESLEVKMAMIAILLPSTSILFFSALAAVITPGLSSLNNAGPHGFSEILYTFSSQSQNNGSAFAGLNGNTDFYNILGGIAMLIGRLGVIVPVIVIAGSMIKKKVTPPSAGTFPTDRPLFVVLLVSIVIIVGALTFFPALSLGPLVEHFLMQAGRTF
ncbi:MAG: potassium-transporting ATPase subunit KdpA [Aggregatilineales bacterium]